MGGGKELPKRLSQKTAKALLKQYGWEETLGGKHNIKMEKPGERPITLPMHKGSEYGPGLTTAILREAGLKAGPGEEQEGSE